MYYTIVSYEHSNIGNFFTIKRSGITFKGKLNNSLPLSISLVTLSEMLAIKKGGEKAK